MDGKKIKCIIWDLDNTIWDGVLLEEEKVRLKEDVVDVIKALDERGILHSISSKNNYDAAIDQLKEFGILDYFIYPQISWEAKSAAVGNIAKLINIGIDTIAFIDDQIFERDEVKYAFPEVLCIDSAEIVGLLDMDEFSPEFITDDSKNRRTLYQNDIRRNQIENEFNGTKEEFLEMLDMVLTISKANEEDLKRAEELTIRTHQLNSTGYTYSYEQLRDFIHSGKHEVLVAQLDDKYGEYGKIGLAIIEKEDKVWNLNLLLMSCRVMSRGVGSVLLSHIVNMAIDNNVTLYAKFVPTPRNRIMYITYKFCGFKELQKSDDLIILHANAETKQAMPNYLELCVC